MLDTIFGLPMHPLIVHAIVGVVPTAALALAMSALWARFRAWADPLPVALGVAAVVRTLLSTSSGQSLDKRVGRFAPIEHGGAKSAWGDTVSAPASSRVLVTTA